MKLPVLWLAAAFATGIAAGEFAIYGHPSAATLQRYATKDVPLFRTDIDSAVTVSTDGAHSPCGRLVLAGCTH